MEIASILEDKSLLDLLSDQFALDSILDSYLISGDVEFDDERPLRWWPAGKKEKVVIDPSRSFGAPIIAENGIQTSVLKRSFDAEGSLEIVANWFQITEDAVQKAVDFENKLAA